MNWMLIAALAIGTYASRVIGVEVMANKEMGTSAKAYFSFVPLGIISALVVKQLIVQGDSGLTISWPMVFACLVTAVAIKLNKSFLLAVISGMAAGIVVRLVSG
ncbi:AzlD domain-containing protein [Bacillus sp. JCM 19041]|uniref:AzlD domain-containing protein n=1 Tax=Bacillus sp. JCM 19041 TaxID=1460637 RepID=UPI0006D02CEA